MIKQNAGHLSAIAALAVLWSAIPALRANAQDYNPIGDVTSWQLNSNILHVQGLLLKEQLGLKDAALEPARHAPVPGGRLTFQRAPDISADTELRFREAMVLMLPGSEEKWDNVLARMDVVDMIDRRMAQVSLNGRDLADCFAYYTVSAWRATNRVAEPSPSDQYRAVAEQFRRVLLARSDVAALDNRGLQQRAESFMVEGYVFDSSSKIEGGSEDYDLRTKAWVRKGALSNGFDPDLVVLTDRGFEAR